MTFDVKRYLDDFGFIREIRSAGYIYIDCPHCSGSRLACWVKSEGKYAGFWRCWRCLEGGNPIQLVMALEDLSWDGAKRRIKQYSTLQPVEDAVGEIEALLRDKVRGKGGKPLKHALRAPSWPDKAVPAWENTRALDYLTDRGFTIQDLEEWGIYYCHHGWYKDTAGERKPVTARLLFPVYQNGIYVGWQSRDVTGHHPIPYKSAKGFRPTQVVYNLDRVGRTIVLAEGVFDAMVCGVEYGVALFTKKLSFNQYFLLQAHKPELIILALDSDAVLEKTELMMDLSGICRVKELGLPQGKDPADLGKNKFGELMKGLLN